jgi:hypothetical protein
MGRSRSNWRAKFLRHLSTANTLLCLALLPAVLAIPYSAAQEIHQHVTYVCNGERIYIDGCSIRDLSEQGICNIANRDKLTPTGIETYTYATRADLKKLLPTCQQPSAKSIAAADAFDKKQQDLYNANVQKSEQQMKGAPQPVSYGQPQKPKTSEERA